MLKVVIADDEARVCQLILMLADWDGLGMGVAGVASNGLEALELVERLHPDILITDIRRPGCHGLELIERAKGEFPQLEIVIISSYAHFEFAQTAIKHGVGDYLIKPIKREELMATLEKLGQRRHNDAIRPIRMVKQYVQEHYSQPITLESVCEVAGFSPSYFSALFKKETGEGFAKYLTHVRMERAKELLQQTNLPVSEICVQVGYSDLKHFTQNFKKDTNLNPGQYRKLYG